MHCHNGTQKLHSQLDLNTSNIHLKERDEMSSLNYYPPMKIGISLYVCASSLTEYVYLKNLCN